MSARVTHGPAPDPRERATDAGRGLTCLVFVALGLVACALTPKTTPTQVAWTVPQDCPPL